MICIAFGMNRVKHRLTTNPQASALLTKEGVGVINPKTAHLKKITEISKTQNAPPTASRRSE